MSDLNKLMMKNISKFNQEEKSITLEQLTYYSAILVFVILPIHVKYIPPLMILWVILWGIENYTNSNFKNWLSGAKRSYIVLFLLFAAYFIIQGLSIFYSKNSELAFSNLFGRLSLIVFPLVLLTPSTHVKFNLNILLRVFVLAVSAYMIFCFGYAIFRSLSLVNGEWRFNPHPEVQYLNYFYSSDLTVGQHPSYTAMYALLSVFISFEMFFDNRSKKIMRLFWLINALFLTISLYFISSRAGLLLASIFVISYFPYKFFKLRYSKTTLIGLGLIFLLMIPVLLRNQRVDYFTGRFFNKKDYQRKEDPRFQLWKNCFRLADRNLILGVGIGDARDELAVVLKEEGYASMADNRYNAHNQFLEVLLETGIVGEILLISIFVCMLWIALKDHNMLYGLFILMMIGFFMFETVLYRFAGVSFFSIFSFFLMHPGSEHSKLKLKTSEAADSKLLLQ